MFKCNQCGQCCKHVNMSVFHKELDRGDGTCKYLEKNLGSIYKNRPILCRVDESYERYFKSQYLLEEYYKLNYKVCNELQLKQRRR